MLTKSEKKKHREENLSQPKLSSTSDIWAMRLYKMRERVFARRASKLRGSGCDCVCLCRGRVGAGAGGAKPEDVAGGAPWSLAGGAGAGPLPTLLPVFLLVFMLRSRFRTNSVQGLAWLLVEVVPLPTESARTFIQPSLSAALSA